MFFSGAESPAIAKRKTDCLLLLDFFFIVTTRGCDKFFLQKVLGWNNGLKTQSLCDKQ